MGKMLVFSINGTPVMFSAFLFISWYWNTLETGILKKYNKECRWFLLTDICFWLSISKGKETKLLPQITGRLALHNQTITIWQKRGECFVRRDSWTQLQLSFEQMSSVGIPAPTARGQPVPIKSLQESFCFILIKTLWRLKMKLFKKRTVGQCPSCLKPF